MSHFAAHRWLPRHLCICPYLKLLSGFCEGVGWLLYIGALHLNDKTFVNSLWQNKPDCSLYKDERKTRRVSFLLRYLWYFHLFYCFVSFFPVMLQNKCLVPGLGCHTTSLTLMHFIQAQWNCFSCSALTMIYPLWSLLLPGIGFRVIYR